MTEDLNTLFSKFKLVKLRFIHILQSGEIISDEFLVAQVINLHIYLVALMVLKY